MLLEMERMGTHGAIGFLKDGQHWCVERTLDGYRTAEIMRVWIQDVIKNEGRALWLPDIDDVGNGGIETNDEREHEQEYFSFIDLDHKVVYVSGSIISFWAGETSVKAVVELLYQFMKFGWEVDIAWDCEEVGDFVQ